MIYIVCKSRVYPGSAGQGLNSENTLKTKLLSIANQNLGIIFRTFIFLDRDVFVNLFKSMLRQHLEYASLVWSSLYKKDKTAIENMQRRSTRLVKSLQGLTYSERQVLGLPTLRYRRDIADLIQMYKIMHGIDIVNKEEHYNGNLNKYKGLKQIQS